MFFPVTMIEEFPHVLISYNFSRKKDRYFLSPYEVEISSHGSQRTVCDIIRSSDFLCGLLNIDRAMVLKQMSNNNTSAGSTTTAENSPSPNADEKTSRRALSCSTAPNNTNGNDLLLTMIEQKLDFKHRCMFYSTGPTSDLCGEEICMRNFLWTDVIFFAVCALDVDYNSSVICNDIGYANLINYDEITGEKSNNDEEEEVKRSPTKSAHKMRYQHRQYVHQWICIRDVIDGLITCNHTLKNKNIMDVLSKMDMWIKQRNEPKKILKCQSLADVKLFKARARQLVWDLMEMK